MATKTSNKSQDVPASASEPKPWFTDPPSDAVLDEIRVHIRDTGDVLSCKYATFSKPDKDSPIRYVAEFELPERFRKQRLYAPCPVCTSGHRKFAVGRVAYFPEEKLLRLIGHICFAKLNKEAHALADEEFQIATKRRNNTRYLLNQENDLRGLREALKTAYDVAMEIDSFGSQLRDKLDRLHGIDLERYTRNGQLEVEESYREFVGREGETKEARRSRVYARIAGHSILKSGLKSYGAAVQRIQRKLLFLDDLGDWNGKVEAMDHDERFKTATSISSSIRLGTDLLNEMRELQKFVEPVNINTIRSWSKDPGCPCTIAIERQGYILSVGRSEANRLPIVIPPPIERDIPQISIKSLKEFKHDEITGQNIVDPDNPILVP